MKLPKPKNRSFLQRMFGASAMAIVLGGMTMGGAQAQDTADIPLPRPRPAHQPVEVLPFMATQSFYAQYNWQLATGDPTCINSDLTGFDAFHCDDNPAMFQRTPNIQEPQDVAYFGNEAAGTIIINNANKKLYFILAPGQDDTPGWAIEYDVAIGREGVTIQPGEEFTIYTRNEWDLYVKDANDPSQDIPGGINNPLGARALFLTNNGNITGDQGYRIHGTNNPEAIGTKASLGGCIRMFNLDVIDLYNRVQNGATVKVVDRDDFEQEIVPIKHSMICPPQMITPCKP